MRKTFYIKDTIKEGWNSFKKDPKFFILVSFLYVAISSIPSLVGMIKEFIEGIESDPVFIMLSAIIQVAVFIIGIVMPIGYTYIMLSAVGGRSYSIRDLFSSHGVFWKFFFVGVLSSIFIIVGLLLFIIPGIFLATALLFASYVVVDEHYKPMDAIKKSYHLTKGYRLKILGFIVVITILNIIGFAILGLGFLVTMPVSGLASVHLYKTLKLQNVAISDGSRGLDKVSTERQDMELTSN